MKGGDIDNVSSPQVICVTDVVIDLKVEEERKLLTKKSVTILGDINLLAVNQLWKLANEYGISLELSGFETEGWTKELLEKAFERLERRVVNPFNYWELYESIDELLSGIPYRPNLKGIVDIPDRVARYGSAGVELSNL